MNVGTHRIVVLCEGGEESIEQQPANTDSRNVPSRTAVNKTLAYIETDQGDYSVLAAAAGAARSYVFDVSRPPQRAGEIAAAEASARTAGRGLWGPPCFGETHA